ncbi:hypothetical protein Pfo_004218 [Paulownia fortunei]|nr:hypothetical protein Pfo_004218 [Paulownia fortunei]
MLAVQDDCNTLFTTTVAAIAWHEMRRAWRAGVPLNQDLLSSKEPVDGPVPLARGLIHTEDVEYLVEVWEEGFCGSRQQPDSSDGSALLGRLQRWQKSQGAAICKTKSPFMTKI